MVEDDFVGKFIEVHRLGRGCHANDMLREHVGNISEGRVSTQSFGNLTYGVWYDIWVWCQRDVSRRGMMTKCSEVF